MSSTTSKTAVRSGLGGIKRNWETSRTSSIDDRDDTQPTAIASPQQSPVRKKPTLSPAEAAAARARRLKAIEDAMAIDTSSLDASTSSPDTSSTTATSSSWATSSDDPFAQGESSSVQLKSRRMPWDTPHDSLRASQKARADTAQDTASTTSESRRGARLDSGLDIRSKICLSNEQKHVLQQVLDGKNVFFTGSAGERLS